MKAPITETDIKLILVMNNKAVTVAKIKMSLDACGFDTSDDKLLDLIDKMHAERKVLYTPTGITWNHKDYNVVEEIYGAQTSK